MELEIGKPGHRERESWDYAQLAEYCKWDAALRDENAGLGQSATLTG
jgi:hypothetical protein